MCSLMYERIVDSPVDGNCSADDDNRTFPHSAHHTGPEITRVRSNSARHVLYILVLNILNVHFKVAV